jgi:glycosyltransferase involved in cell wall biosynthesis
MVNPREHTYVIIPAKDEGPRIERVVKAVQEAGFDHIIVVDDGSRDHTGKIAARAGATVLRHLINLGAGAATQTGIAFALSQQAQYLVTLDGDGQHLAEDITLLMERLWEQDLDLVIGSRFLLKENKIPPVRRFYNLAGNFITFLVTGIYLSDSQSGFRAFRKEVAELLKTTQNGFEYCSETIIYVMEEKLRYEEVPIQVLYTDETMQKGQNFLNGLNMIWRLFTHKLIK